ncbi:MAG: PAS domain-containing protein [Pirellulaceae bacterium]
MSSQSMQHVCWDAPGGFVMLDIAGVILGHNREFASLLGQNSNATLVGMNCHELWNQQSLSDFGRFWEKVTSSPGMPFQCCVSADISNAQIDISVKGRLLSDAPEYRQVLLVAEPFLQFDVDSVNGVFALGFEQQSDAAIIFASGPTLAESRILAANVVAAKNCGRKGVELPGMAVKSLAPQDLSPKVWIAAESAFAEGQPFETTYVEHRGGGQYGIVEWNFWPIHADDERVTLWADRRRTVTDDKERADQLLEHNRFLTEALLASEVGIWQWDLVNNKIDFSQRLITSLGYRPEDIADPNEFNLSLRCPEDVPMMEASIRQAVEAGTTFEYVARLKAADGNFRWVRVRGQAFRDADGRPTKLVGTESEVSEEFILRERLLRGEEIAKIGYWSRRFDPPTLEWSPGAFRIQGYDPATYTPDPSDAHKLIHPDDQHVMASALRRILKTRGMNRGNQDVFRSRILRPDGSVRHCEFHAVADFDEAGTQIGASGTIQDITDLVEMENRLLQAQKLEVVGQLAGGVAHDFNNLLAVIMGNLELLTEVKDPSRWPEFINAAMQATQRGGELTRNLLSFARKAALQLAVLNLNQVIVETTEMMRRVLPKTVRIETCFADHLWPVLADRTSFENALLNLAINARDAMPEGGTLSIGTENLVLEDGASDAIAEDLSSGNYVVVSVRDTGIGISEDILPDIFAPFFSTKPDRKGSGLGLSMVLGFAKQSGGGVRVVSSPGEGTTFSLFFPSTDRVTAEVPKAHAFSHSGRLHGRVLLVEDDLEVNKLLLRQVETLGLSCVTSSDSEQAVRLFNEEGPFDLLLTDIVIPGPFNGPKLARHLRTLHPDLKVILVSGYPDEAVMQSTGVSPEDIRLTKPVSKQELQSALQRVLCSNDVYST